MCDWSSTFLSISTDILGLIRRLPAALQDVFVCMWGSTKSQRVSHRGKTWGCAGSWTADVPFRASGGTMHVSVTVCLGLGWTRPSVPLWMLHASSRIPALALRFSAALTMSQLRGSTPQPWKLLWPIHDASLNLAFRNTLVRSIPTKISAKQTRVIIKWHVYRITSMCRGTNS